MRDLFIRKAEAYLGTPYVWGGDCPAEGGLDCSGFVFNALNDVGIKVGRTTAQGYYNKFAANACGQGTKGALLFFGKSKKNVTHVAISLGDGRMIESIGSSKNTKTNKGKGVTISRISRRKDLVACCDPLINYVAPFYPRYTGVSTKLDEILKAVGAPYGSVTKRAKLANINGIVDYKGTLSQNLKLINLAKTGKLVRV